MDGITRPASKKKNSRLSLPQHRVRTKALAVVLDLDLYEFEKVIGEGKFSSVVAGRNKESGQVRLCFLSLQLPIPPDARMLLRCAQ